MAQKPREQHRFSDPCCWCNIYGSPRTGGVRATLGEGSGFTTPARARGVLITAPTRGLHFLEVISFLEPPHHARYWLIALYTILVEARALFTLPRAQRPLTLPFPDRDRCCLLRREAHRVGRRCTCRKSRRLAGLLLVPTIKNQCEASILAAGMDELPGKSL